MSARERELEDRGLLCEIGCQSPVSEIADIFVCWVNIEISDVCLVWVGVSHFVKFLLTQPIYAVHENSDLLFNLFP